MLGTDPCLLVLRIWYLKAIGKVLRRASHKRGGHISPFLGSVFISLCPNWCSAEFWMPWLQVNMHLYWLEVISDLSTMTVSVSELEIHLHPRNWQDKWPEVCFLSCLTVSLLPLALPCLIAQMKQVPWYLCFSHHYIHPVFLCVLF